ncbi:VOC family protein [Novosphingobium mangrovi (ex Huang et al. 2023)]|uniref:VOC family protein n=1 Tax=Novosphingobium mangrovi (ex Huang et al. 2023) TaxID=2976432 RepID=A0ABT2I9R0_9SPHN|nr:VOC family protein [Novosphingobium mangrovi (ex Huang et al. 2023)]MCT2401557.1 VOC family protein [Novosphingobium mangrovi (ex Huang et al. 2023)]
MAGSLTQGAHHIGLVVRDLDEARGFFCDALGFEQVGAVPDYPALFVSDGTTLLTLWRAADPQTANAFDRHGNIGLHHLALRVADDVALDGVHDRVKGYPGTTVEFAPEPIREGASTRHFICTMPGGIRIEFATPFA